MSEYFFVYTNDSDSFTKDSMFYYTTVVSVTQQTPSYEQCSACQSTNPSLGNFQNGNGWGERGSEPSSFKRVGNESQRMITTSFISNFKKMMKIRVVF